MTTPGIIVALDGMNKQKALELAAKIKGYAWGFKVNDLFFSEGISLLRELKEFGNVFCDGKFHDIPNTVANTISSITENDAPDLITIHSSGGKKMIQAAVEAAEGKSKIIAVTALTSLDDESCNGIFGTDAAQAARKLAGIAVDASADGIVCSPHELSAIRADFPALETIVPGIRPSWYGVKDDQARAASPAAAAQAGATYIVIGRPVVKADDPAEALEKITNEMVEG